MTQRYVSTTFYSKIACHMMMWELWELWRCGGVKELSC